MSGLWWLVLEIALVLFLVVELVRVRASIRKDREKAARRKASGETPSDAAEG